MLASRIVKAGVEDRATVQTFGFGLSDKDPNPESAGCKTVYSCCKYLYAFLSPINRQSSRNNVFSPLIDVIPRLNWSYLLLLLNKTDKILNMSMYTSRLYLLGRLCSIEFQGQSCCHYNFIRIG